MFSVLYLCSVTHSSLLTPHSQVDMHRSGMGSYEKFFLVGTSHKMVHLFVLFFSHYTYDCNIPLFYMYVEGKANSNDLSRKKNSETNRG